MSRYVQIFLGPPGAPEEQVVADVESATDLRMEPRAAPQRGYRGSNGTRGILLVPGTDYEDEPHLPFSRHPFQLEFYTAEKTIESERRFLDETFRFLRATGRYDLFATLDVQSRIDPQ